MQRRLRGKRSSVKQRSSKRPLSPYANIQWDKATTLFASYGDTKVPGMLAPHVRSILAMAMKAGAAGLTLIFEAEKRGKEFLHPGYDADWRIRQLIRQLERQHYLRVHEKGNGVVTVRIVKKGMVRALTYQLDTMRLKKQASWDRKWRVVIFDIPVQYNRVRDLFRMRLVQLGLYRLQESVYVSPYPCFDEVEFLRSLYGVPFTVRYIIATKIEEDDSVKRHFELSSLEPK